MLNSFEMSFNLIMLVTFDSAFLQLVIQEVIWINIIQIFSILLYMVGFQMDFQ